ncbi:MAG: glycosyltransferase family 39 protein [Thainema sp.]
MTTIAKHRGFQTGLLLLWCAIALVLRFTHLAQKPLWTDEFSTLVFGLGHSFQTIPLDQPISTDVLLAPLQPLPLTGVGAVTYHLFSESNHPPLYFILTHEWLKLFPIENPWVLTWAARSLSALFGVLTVPAIFLLGWVTFQSVLIAQLAAALMAVSPFGIYIAQEARHYTLPTMLGSLSLCCFVQAVRAICDRTRLNLGLVLSWIGLNALGIATHYFFVFVVTAQGMVLLGFFLWRSLGTMSEKPSNKLSEFWQSWSRPPWWHVFAAGLGTAISGAVWLPVIQSVQDDELTWWIYRLEGRIGLDWLQPVLETVAGVATMFFLLPIQGTTRAVEIGSIGLMLLLLIWLGGVWINGVRQYAQLHRSTQPQASLWATGGFLAAAIALMWFLSYAFNMSLTNGFRYNFIYYPAAILLFAVALAAGWQTTGGGIVRSQRWTTVVVLLLGIVGSLVVALDFGYQKTHRPDLVVDTLLQQSQDPVVMAMSHQTHGQTGRMMGIALELQRRSGNLPIQSPQYILDHSVCQSRYDLSCYNPTPKLKETLATLPRPFDLWLMNYHSGANLRDVNCEPTAPNETRRVDGYRFYRYRCQPMTKG